MPWHAMACHGVPLGFLKCLETAGRARKDEAAGQIAVGDREIAQGAGGYSGRSQGSKAIEMARTRSMPSRMSS